MAEEIPVVEVDAPVLDLGYHMAVDCPVQECQLPNHRLAVAIVPIIHENEPLLFGSLTYLDCGHNFTCQHLVTRCATLLEEMESGAPLTPELIADLVVAEHADVAED